MIGKI